VGFKEAEENYENKSFRERDTHITTLACSISRELNSSPWFRASNVGLRPWISIPIRPRLRHFPSFKADPNTSRLALKSYGI
jgi:hypothetical protein